MNDLVIFLNLMFNQVVSEISSQIAVEVRHTGRKIPASALELLKQNVLHIWPSHHAGLYSQKKALSIIFLSLIIGKRTWFMLEGVYSFCLLMKLSAV